MDGRDFLKQVVIPDVAMRIHEGGSRVAKKDLFVVMNLPAIAIEFLDVFPGCLTGYLGERRVRKTQQESTVEAEAEAEGSVASTNSEAESVQAATESVQAATEAEDDFAMIVYCYCFSNAVSVVADTRSRVEEVLKTKLKDENCQIRHVRNVAPKKEMMVARLRLTPDILLSSSKEVEEQKEEEEKGEEEEPMEKRQKLS